MLPRVASEKLAEFCDVFYERGYFDVEQSRRILAAGKKLGLKLRIHADQLTNSGGAKLAAELNATTADHLEQTEEEGSRRCDPPASSRFCCQGPCMPLDRNVIPAPAR
jgi:Imidazolonepropionase and related amidohydrolases